MDGTTTTGTTKAPTDVGGWSTIPAANALTLKTPEPEPDADDDGEEDEDVDVEDDETPDA
jgi:hypothetical protein